MLPIRDHNPTRRTPCVAWALIAINVAVFLSYFWMAPSALNAFFCTWGLIPAEASSFFGLITSAEAEAARAQGLCSTLSEGVAAYDGLLTTMFLHGGWMHLIGNMLFLYIFGDNLEDYLGHVGFLIFYLLGGLAASALHILMGPASPIPTVGASGAIAAVMGGYLLLYPRAKVDILVFLGIYVNIFAIQAWIMLLIWFAMQVGGALLENTTGGGVAYWAHAGGFVAGLLLVGIVWLLGRQPERVDGHPDHPVVHYKMRKGPWS